MSKNGLVRKLVGWEVGWLGSWLVGKLVGWEVGWLGSWLIVGAGRNEEHLYDAVMDSFNTAFTDTTSMQKAKAEFRSLKMEMGELDTYIAKFKRLARLAGYNLQDQMVLDQFGSGLNPGLFSSIINNTDPRTWLD